MRVRDSLTVSLPPEERVFLAVHQSDILNNPLPPFLDFLLDFVDIHRSQAVTVTYS